jgi:ribosomal protein S8
MYCEKNQIIQEKGITRVKSSNTKMYWESKIKQYKKYCKRKSSNIKNIGRVKSNNKKYYEKKQTIQKLFKGSIR